MARTRRPGGRPRSRTSGAVGIAVGAAALLVALVVAIQWAIAVAHRDAVDSALRDVPGLQASAPAGTAASVAAPPDAQPVEVVRVIDGDTLVVTGEPGAVLSQPGETTIRLLEIDTPEVDGPNTTEQCFGPQASEYAKSLLPTGSTLLLARDKELTDRYGRTLAYAWTPDGAFVNETILRNGYGYSTLVMPNEQFISTMLAAEDAARADRLGLWGTC